MRTYGVSLPGVSLPDVTLLPGVSAPVVVFDVPLPAVAVSVDVETSTSVLAAGGWQPKAAASMTTERVEKIIRHNFTVMVLLGRSMNGI